MASVRWARPGRRGTLGHAHRHANPFPRAAADPLVSVRRIGNQKHYQANPHSPIFGELCSIIRKTVGLADPVREALQPVVEDIHLAFVYGSVAKGTSTAASDVDLMVVSDRLALTELLDVLEPVDGLLGRPVNPTLYTRDEFAKRRADADSFVSRVLAGDVIVLHGDIGEP